MGASSPGRSRLRLGESLSAERVRGHARAAQLAAELGELGCEVRTWGAGELLSVSVSSASGSCWVRVGAESVSVHAWERDPEAVGGREGYDLLTRASMSVEGAAAELDAHSAAALLRILTSPDTQAQV